MKPEKFACPSDMKSLTSLMARLPRPDPHDRLKHFNKDGPAWRLGALFIERLPAILTSTSGIMILYLFRS
jgi:hypothetical protein